MWTEWTECVENMKTRSRRKTSICDESFLKKNGGYEANETHREQIKCGDCPTPQWSEWTRDSYGACILRRHCLMPKNSDCTAECAGEVARTIPCNDAEICNKQVQLTNHRGRLLSVRPPRNWANQHSSSYALEFTPKVPGSNSENAVWSFCCNPADGVNVAMVFNSANNGTIDY